MFLFGCKVTNHAGGPFSDNTITIGRLRAQRIEQAGISFRQIKPQFLASGQSAPVLAVLTLAYMTAQPDRRKRWVFQIDHVICIDDFFGKFKIAAKSDSIYRRAIMSRLGPRNVMGSGDGQQFLAFLQT